MATVPGHHRERGGRSIQQLAQLLLEPAEHPRPGLADRGRAHAQPGPRVRRRPLLDDRQPERLPEPLRELAAGVLEGPPVQLARLRRFVRVLAGRLGGVDSNLSTFEAYMPATGRWETLTPIPEARGGSGLAFADGLLVSVGGEGPDNTTIGTFDVSRMRRQTSVPSTSGKPRSRTTAA